MKQSKKIHLRLRARQADYLAMIAKPRSDDWSGYKKPGSPTGNPQQGK